MARLCCVNHVGLEGLRTLSTPARTETHVPIPHYQAASMVLDALKGKDWEIVGTDFGLSHENSRMFGVVEIGLAAMDYRLVVGIRNAHDKRFTYGIVFGAKVMVCSNLDFYGEEIGLSAKHCKNVLDGIGFRVENGLAGLENYRAEQEAWFDRFRKFFLTDQQAHDLIIQGARNGSIPSNKIVPVVEEYHNPRHTEFASRTMWSLFNAHTEILKGSNLHDLAGRTNTIHRLANEMISASFPIMPISFATPPMQTIEASRLN